MLIFYAHPNKDGHCGCFLENVVKILTDEKIDYEIIDLYVVGFSPVLKPEEHYTSGHKEVAPQIRDIQEKMKQHDKYIFIYPTWWQNVPGILKGVIDRVFLPGFGFTYEGKIPRGLLKDKKALIFTSTGAPRFITKLIYGDRSVKVLKKDILSFCGIKSKAHVIDNAKYFSEKQKERINKVVSRAMKSFFVLLFAFFLVLPGLALSRIDSWQDIHEKKYWMSREEKQDTASQEAESPESLYLRALAALSLRQDEKAESLFRDILEISSENIPARWGIAEIDRRNYRFEESRKDLEEIIQLQPNFVPARISLAYIYYTEGKYDECIEIVEEIQEEYSDYLDTGNRIRTLLILGGAKGMLAEEASIIGRISLGLRAVSHLREARDINPDDTGVLFAWGSYYLMAPRAVGGDIDKAESNLLKALEKDPRFADIHARLAQLYLKEGDKEKADRYILKAKELDDRNPLLQEVLKDYQE